jgi:hypothetical protein
MPGKHKMGQTAEDKQSTHVDGDRESSYRWYDDGEKTREDHQHAEHVDHVTVFLATSPMEVVPAFISFLR